jgi:hypothetical protein
MHHHTRAILAATLAPAIGLGGCTQMTQHSNMLVFGTNTSLAVSVGSGAVNTPEIVLGYKRQEAVLIPLLANTGMRFGTGTEAAVATPCSPETTVKTTEEGKGGNPPKTTTETKYPTIADCKFVGKNGEQDLDSYSVLASFGAHFKANKSTQAEATVGIAQYFATGLAARTLAERGGASLVATGDAATANATSKALAELQERETVSKSNFISKVKAHNDGFDTWIAGVAKKSKISKILRACTPAGGNDACVEALKSVNYIVSDWEALSAAADES